MKEFLDKWGFYILVATWSMTVVLGFAIPFIVQYQLKEEVVVPAWEPKDIYLVTDDDNNAAPAYVGNDFEAAKHVASFQERTIRVLSHTGPNGKVEYVGRWLYNKLEKEWTYWDNKEFPTKD